MGKDKVSVYKGFVFCIINSNQWIFLFFFYFSYPIFVFIHFCLVVFGRSDGLMLPLFRVLEIIVILIFPLLFLALFDGGQTNDCCTTDTVFFSPQYRPSVYSIIILCIAAYFYSSLRKSLGPPLLDLLANCLLLTGIILNVLILIQSNNNWLFYLPGCGSVILLLIALLVKNHQRITDFLENNEIQANSVISKVSWKILTLHPLLKLPVFIIICLPILIIAGSILLLFGQKPDSFIRAFTDTYHLGFSQLNAECDNVECGGHYLCSVAANGHKGVVKPKRMGERASGKIICNRQLLISNAFEDLIQEKLPLIHKPIRKVYNKVGNVVHKYYGIFNNKFVADFVYFLMKPLEWIFIMALYMLDTKPENRIAKQYLNSEDRKKIHLLEKSIIK